MEFPDLDHIYVSDDILYLFDIIDKLDNHVGGNATRHVVIERALSGTWKMHIKIKNHDEAENNKRI